MGQTDKDPRTWFWEDLKTFLEFKKQQGHSLIVGGDFNVDVRSRQVRAFFHTLHMDNIILSRHPENAPATYVRNESGISIDGIFVSSGIVPDQAGYAPYGIGCPSDHRMLWVDIPWSELFGQNVNLPRPYILKLNASDPRQVKRYNEQSFNKLGQEVLDTLRQLDKVPAGQFTTTEIDTFNVLLEKNTDIRMKIKTQSRHLYWGTWPWSPQWKRKEARVTLFNLLLKYKGIKHGWNTERKKPNLKQIRRWMRLADEPNALSLTPEAMEEEYKRARKELDQAKPLAARWRQDHLLKLDQSQALEKGVDIKVITKARKRVEFQRRLGRNLAALKGKRREIVDTVFTKDEQGRLISCSTREEMEKACMNENKKRFTQTSNTPPMEQNLCRQVGFCAEGQAAGEILNGSFPIDPQTDHFMKLVLEGLRMPIPIQQSGWVDSTISEEEHKWAWRRQKEKTASERTLLGFSDHKAAIAHAEMCEIDRLFRQIPYRQGFAPTIHRTITDFQILKQPGNFAVEAMRTIQLMPAAFNMNNKRTGQKVMSQAEQYNLIPPEQAGSRKGRRAIESALEKVLSWDCLRHRRLNGVMISNDAKSCYDRIVLWVASLAMQRMGIHPLACQEMLATLQSATHHVSTAFGDSKEGYGHDLQQPLQGVGQGNGAGPAIWAAISAILLNITRNSGKGLQWVSPISDQLVHSVGFAFVDDTDLIHFASDGNQSSQNTVSEAQNMVNLWEGILRATGGAIRADKSFWYLIDWKFEKGKWKYKDQEELQANLFVKSDDGSVKELDRLDPQEARKTLGVYISPNGNYSRQKQVLVQKAREFAAKVETGCISREDSWYAFKFSFMKTIEYPALVTQFTKEEWDEIMRPVIPIVLQRAGFPKTFPRTLIYAPNSKQGLGIRHPHYSSLITQIRWVLAGGKSSSQGRLLLQLLTEELREEIGLGGSVGQWEWANLEGLFTKSWLSEVLRQAQHFQIKIIDPYPQLCLQREKDQFLTELFINQGFTGGSLRQLNWCRRYIKATTLADITSADGKKITRESWDGETPTVGSNHRVRLPPRNKLDWALWKQALNSLIVSNKSRLLRQPLGAWLQPPNIQDRHATKWLYSHTEDILIERKGHVWQEWKRIPRRTNQRNSLGWFDKGNWRITNLPADTSRAEVFRWKDKASLRSIGNHLTKSPHATTSTLDEVIQNQKDFSFIREFWQKGMLETFCTAVEANTAIAVSDGSFKESQGTAAFILQDKLSDPKFRILGVNRIPGPAEDQSAFRAELGGILGVLQMVKAIHEIRKMDTGSLILALDGKSAMRQAAGQDPVDPTYPSADIINAIRKLKAHLKIKIHFRWVEGHQSERHGHSDQWGHLNNVCDASAKRYWEETRLQTEPKEYVLHQNIWRATIHNRSVATLKESKLYTTMSQEDTIQYWSKRHGWTRHTQSRIDWDAIESAWPRWPFGKRRWMLKHLSGFSAVGKVMQRRQEWQHAKCPRCEALMEDAAHVLRCPAKTAQQAWSRAIGNFKSKLGNIQTCPELTDTVCTLLESRGQLHKYIPTNVRMNRAIREKLTLAVKAQNGIGWDQFTYGRIATEWKDAQQMWLLRQAGRWKKSADKWQESFCVHAMNLSWAMWDNRNDILHQPQHQWKQRALQLAKDRAKQTLQQLQQSQLLKGRDRRLTLMDGNRLEGWSLDQILRWESSIEAATQRQAQQEARARATQPTLLDRWLIRQPRIPE